MPRGPSRRGTKEPPPDVGGCGVGIDDPRAPLGIRVETTARDGVVEVIGRPSFVLPIHASAIACTTSGIPDATVLDRSGWLLLPKGQPACAVVRSATATTMVLSPHRSLERRVEDTYGSEVDARALARALATPFIAPRTTWVNELAHRYAFERAVCKKRENAATTFLEVELVKEWFFVRRDAEETARGRRSHVDTGRPLSVRAREWIDAHLDQPITVAALARILHASPSAVLRAFQQELGVAPMAYVRGKRLDEALLLLQSGTYSVGEVATRVGYESFAAFSQAFRARFASTPSSFLGATRARPIK